MQAHGGLWLIIHSGCLYGVGQIFSKLNFGPIMEYINIKIIPALDQIGLIDAVWSTLFTVFGWMIPFGTAAVGTNLLFEALRQRTGKENPDKKTPYKPKCLDKLIRKKLAKYKLWSPSKTKEDGNNQS
ncbi:hypothetical protein C9J03_24720 [Photobacterium gaetbulicola]|uniref:Uncharacterized protein n=1 Tax=Photobacterium gaetbulicola TaxID=1295392 RepID=A0A0B9H1I6_9GAMM|nr:hypothetical protein RJ45_04545 [Photobacterium gaetbulicola]PSU00776.1 hypothetical protein C9J03_24720 [Photobacterium gaetbulicola]